MESYFWLAMGAAPSRNIFIRQLFERKQKIDRDVTYSRLDGSSEASSPSILYTLPDMTYSKLSAREPSVSRPCGFQSPLSGYPSSRSVVANTRRNLSPENYKLFTKYQFESQTITIEPVRAVYLLNMKTATILRGDLELEL